MADDKAMEKMVEVAQTRVPTPTEVAVASFHQGAHPQRPIPADLTDAEKRGLDRERSNIHAPNRVPLDEPAAVPGSVNAPVWADPKRPAKGMLFMGATAREEALLLGIEPRILDMIEKERADRLEVAEKMAKAAADQPDERLSAPDRAPTPLKK